MTTHQTGSISYYINQTALESPPQAPSKYIFVVPAIALVGRAKIPDWRDAERTAIVEDDGTMQPGIDAINSAAKLLQQAIMDRKITAYRRRPEGGGLFPMSASDWIIDQIPESIIREGIFCETVRGPVAFKKGPKRGSLPTMSQFSVDLEYYVFLDRAELQRALDTEQPAESIHRLPDAIAPAAPQIGDENMKKPEISSPIWSARVNREIWEPEARRVAAMLDTEGVAVRDVRKPHVAERWNNAVCSPVSVDIVRGFMTGKPKDGRPPKVSR